MNNLLHKIRADIEGICNWYSVFGRWASVGAALFLLLPLGAQVTTDDLPYVCDFEDDAEIAQWVLNPG